MKIDHTSGPDLTSEHRWSVEQCRGGYFGTSQKFTVLVQAVWPYLYPRTFQAGPTVPKVQGVPCARRLGCVDFDFECSTACPTLLGLLGIWQKWLGKMVEHRNNVNPTQVYEHMGRPVRRGRNPITSLAQNHGHGRPWSCGLLTFPLSVLNNLNLLSDADNLTVIIWRECGETRQSVFDRRNENDEGKLHSCSSSFKKFYSLRTQ